MRGAGQIPPADSFTGSAPSPFANQNDAVTLQSSSARSASSTADSLSDIITARTASKCISNASKLLISLPDLPGCLTNTNDVTTSEISHTKPAVQPTHKHGAARKLSSSSFSGSERLAGSDLTSERTATFAKLGDARGTTLHDSPGIALHNTREQRSAATLTVPASGTASQRKGSSRGGHDLFLGHGKASQIEATSDQSMNDMQTPLAEIPTAARQASPFSLWRCCSKPQVTHPVKANVRVCLDKPVRLVALPSMTAAGARAGAGAGTPSGGVLQESLQTQLLRDVIREVRHGVLGLFD